MAANAETLNQGSYCQDVDSVISFLPVGFVCVRFAVCKACMFDSLRYEQV